MTTWPPDCVVLAKVGMASNGDGHRIVLDEANLRAAAMGYDPTIHEAPLVNGSPKHDSPAMGWVRSLRFAEGTLTATLSQVYQPFMQAVRKGDFKRMAGTWYRPDAKGNPFPGVLYLRHVEFHGMPSAAFAEGMAWRSLPGMSTSAVISFASPFSIDPVDLNDPAELARAATVLAERSARMGAPISIAEAVRSISTQSRSTI